MRAESGRSAIKAVVSRIGPALPSMGVVAILTLVWGTTWGAIRVSLSGIPPMAGVALRFAIAGSLLWVVARLMGIRLGGSRRLHWLWVFNALTTFAGAYGITYWSEQWIPSGLASILFASFPLFVTAFAHFVLPQERLVSSRLVGVVVGFLGVVIIFSNDLRGLGGAIAEGSGAAGGGRILVAALVMLGSPLMAALGQVGVKRWGAGEHPFNLTAPPMLLAALVMAGVSVLFEGEASYRWSAGPILALLYLAIVGSALTFTLYFWLLSRHSATGVSLMTYGIPVVAVLVGAVFLDEQLSGRALLGAGVVIAGVALASPHQGARRRAAVGRAAAGGGEPPAPVT